MIKPLLLFLILLLAPSQAYAKCVSGNCLSGTGVNFWKSGSNYSGEWKRGKMHGKGTYIWADGSKYIGEWKAGKKEGVGAYIWKNGDKYEGGWKNDKKHGKGTLTKVNGDTYTGQWADNMKNGTGTYLWKNGDSYEGGWKKNHRSGYGTLSNNSGDFYIGEWKKSLMHGQGKYQWKNGDVYSGQWGKGLRHGSGLQITSLGDKFSGNWVNGKMNGFGIFAWHTGSVYIGNWKGNNMVGKGNFTTVTELNRTKPGYLETLFAPKKTSTEEKKLVAPIKEEPLLAKMKENLLGIPVAAQKNEAPLNKKIDINNLELNQTFKVTQRTPLLAEQSKNGSTIKNLLYLKVGETFTVKRRKASRDVILYFVIFHEDQKGLINSRTLKEGNLQRVSSSPASSSP